ncbi:PRC-barrel domain-containing protein [Sphingomonas sp. GCM10030256]|uniref:PRC-barrel domain-containing protein n=1 Tax=Sphingomonas sp. GCM10030256 TaxID=3273427 RepID=UPI0036091B44
MEQLASWVAPIATTVAALMTASNLGSRITGYGFIVFTVGSIAWLTLGVVTNQPNLLWQNVILTVLNLFGIWRWLGRQAKLEDGADRASAKSADTPGEALIAASNLASAKLLGRSKEELGTCVDAMLGCGSGRLRYLVVAQGGLAGVGESFRRVDWGEVRIADGAVHLHLDQRAFAALPKLDRDNWPGR